MRGLTVINPELEQAEAQTAQGMAHWAGSGPENARCGKCVFYGYSYRKPNGDPGNRMSSCEKYFQITSRHGDSLSKNQLGCKYFSTEEVTARTGDV